MQALEWPCLALVRTKKKGPKLTNTFISHVLHVLTSNPWTCRSVHGSPTKDHSMWEQTSRVWHACQVLGWPCGDGSCFCCSRSQGHRVAGLHCTSRSAARHSSLCVFQGIQPASRNAKHSVSTLSIKLQIQQNTTIPTMAINYYHMLLLSNFQGNFWNDCRPSHHNSVLCSPGTVIRLSTYSCTKPGKGSSMGNLAILVIDQSTICILCIIVKCVHHSFWTAN